MKCITHECPNCSDQGEGRIICVEPDDDGWICEPCWIFITKSTGRLNQIYTNAKKVLRQRQRDQDSYYGGQAAADAIRNNEPDETLSPALRDIVRAIKEGSAEAIEKNLPEKIFPTLKEIRDERAMRSIRCKN